MPKPPCDLSDVIEETLLFHETFLDQSSLDKLQNQLTAKKPFLGMLMWPVKSLSNSRLGAAILLWLMVWFYPKSCFSDGKATPVYVVSLTHNNTRALTRILPFLSPTPTINQHRPSAKQRWNAMRTCWRASQTLSRRPPGKRTPLVRTQQLLGVASILLFDQDWRVAQPRLVIAANDHSAPTVALFALARAWGLRSCYAQHGSITDSFPPLAYDLSVLYNAHSRNLYSQSAKRQGVEQPDENAVCLYPENPSAFVQMKIPEKPLSVCVALSFFLDLPALKQLVDTLRANPNVTKIYLNQHPRCRVNLKQAFAGTDVVLLPREQRAEKHSALVDLCLVSNSGVTLEYLHAGVPTFYWAGGDHSPDDYYGFVQAGILPRFHEEILNDTDLLAADFDATWVTKYAQFSPLVQSDIASLNAQLKGAFRKLLSQK